MVLEDAQLVIGQLIYVFSKGDGVDYISDSGGIDNYEIGRASCRERV